MLRVIAVLVLVQLAVGLPVGDGYVDYSNHNVYRIYPKDMKNVEDLQNLINEFEKSVDFWNEPMPDMRPVLSLIGPNGKDFLSALTKSSIKYEFVYNFQRMIDEEREHNSLSAFDETFDFETKYHTYAEIKDELTYLSSAKSTKVAYKSVGASYEAREIPAIIITNPGNTTQKQTIFFECGIHAREWISPAACLFMADKLLNDPVNDALLTKYEFIIVPTLNVDGYAYTWEHDRQWRLTRSKIPNSTHIGVDPNRNWDDHWCEQGASKTPGSETYCGPSAFSEPETKQMAALITSRKGHIAAYFSFHSYSELWMYPYGYQKAKPANAARLDELSKIGVAAIKAAHGLTFTYGDIYSTIYPASGSSIDWAYDKADAKITFTLELRDKGTYGFVLPPAQIKAASEETWAGIRAVIEAL